MDYDYYDTGYYKLSQEEQDFLRLIQYSTWRMARVLAEQKPELAERVVDYLREELRRVKNEKRPAGLVTKKP